MDESYFLEGQDPERTAIVPAFESTIAIRDDLNDRRGFDLGDLDEDTLEDILQTWIKIIEPRTRVFARAKMLQAFGLFWAEKFPTEVLPTNEMTAVVDRILPAS